MSETPDIADTTLDIADRLDLVVAAIDELRIEINSLAFTTRSFGDSRRTQHQRIHTNTVEAHQLVRDALDDVVQAGQEAREYVDSLPR